MVARTASSRHGGIHPARSTQFSPTTRHACLLYELYRTILTAMVSSCDVLFCMGCRPRCTVPLVGAANVEIGFEIKVRSGIADLKIRSGRGSPHG